MNSHCISVCTLSRLMLSVFATNRYKQHTVTDRNYRTHLKFKFTVLYEHLNDRKRIGDTQSTPIDIAKAYFGNFLESEANTVLKALLGKQVLACSDLLKCAMIFFITWTLCGG